MEKLFILVSDREPMENGKLTGVTITVQKSLLKFKTKKDLERLGQIVKEAVKHIAGCEVI